MAFQCDIPARSTIQQDDTEYRITRWDFAPGAVTGWHEHGYPYVVVMITAGRLCIHNGTTTSEVELQHGQAYSRPAGVRHDVMNASDHPIAFIEIEMKER